MIMKEFDPIKHIENSNLALDNGKWPTFHDAEVHNLNIWRGDVRPEDNVWIGTQMDVSFELCALQYPYMVLLRFHDCDSIKLGEYDYQNSVYDLTFTFEDRGKLRDGTPMTPYICVTFIQAINMALSFKCMRVEVLERREIKNII
jgi:hypothetical protein